MLGTIFLALLAASCCPKRPLLNTVKTAHGNTDWHIDTAEEFLTGKQMDGARSAANHCPDTWTRTHMHVGDTSTNVYYHDASLDAAGKDVDATRGIDTAMLFFYAGHGGPDGFDTLGNGAAMTEMRLGNCDGSTSAGTLRYFWQCSCEVFAHGPKTCGGVARQRFCRSLPYVSAPRLGRYPTASTARNEPGGRPCPTRPPQASSASQTLASPHPLLDGAGDLPRPLLPHSRPRLRCQIEESRSGGQARRRPPSRSVRSTRPSSNFGAQRRNGPLREVAYTEVVRPRRATGVAAPVHNPPIGRIRVLCASFEPRRSRSFFTFRPRESFA